MSGAPKRRKRGPALAGSRNVEVSSPASPVTGESVDVPVSGGGSSLGARVVAGLLLTGLALWSYWPTLTEMVRTWNREPDYSHGFLVPPLAAMFLWMRRSSFPGVTAKLAWPGLALIGLSLAIRYVAAQAFLEFLDGWSLLLWIAGGVWLLFGWRVLAWSWSSIAFLWFMMPVPFSAERLLSQPLQRIATILSCWTLQLLGQPALAEGNVILLGDHRLEVAEACSGLRIFMSIVALSAAYMILVQRAWWERLLLVAAIVPVALIANAGRIVTTGLLYQFVSSDAARKFSHDLAGFVMIPFAAGLFALVLWYLGKLTRPVGAFSVPIALSKQSRPA